MRGIMTTQTPLRIAVHDGVFHADDVFAVAILKIIHKDIEIIRSRDEAVLAQAQMRLDVGGKYAPESGDFDHHLVDGAGERKNGIPYASCGLIWKHFGSQIAKTKNQFEYIDKRLIQSIDAIDCGYSVGEEDLIIQHYSVSDAIDVFNPVWFKIEEGHDRAFSEAVDFAVKLILLELDRAIGFDKARSIITEAVENATNPHLLVLDRYCPWQIIINEYPDILYVVFPSTTGDWRVRAVPRQMGGFACRKQLPEAWAGAKKEHLAAITGVSDALFCHPARFIAGAVSKDGALVLAHKALDNR